ncbi:MAG: hypothetical protein U1D30_23420 [Planctomycetota bacterium]
MSRPGSFNRPEAGRSDFGNRPGMENRPGVGERPGVANRPDFNQFGAQQRPSERDLQSFLNLGPERPNVGDRPIEPGQRGEFPGRQDGRGPFDGNPQNRAENRQDRVGDRQDRVDNRQDRVGDRQDRLNDRQDRRQNWQERGNNIRNEWRNEWQDRRNDWFSHNWWNNHPYPRNWYWNHGYPYHWWGWASWAGVTGFIAGAWAAPLFYDYGSGGNVVYEDNSVYVNGEDVGTQEEYAQQAMDLADSGNQMLNSDEQYQQPPPDSQDQNSPQQDSSMWMPLGVFALSSDGGEAAPTKMMQLAVSKDGVIAGTYFNTQTDQTLAIQGKVDRLTQRAAWTVGDNKNTVFDTGIYNLTQNETPVLVHFGTGTTQNWFLVRLDPPKDQGNPGSNPPPAPNDPFATPPASSSGGAD